MSEWPYQTDEETLTTLRDEHCKLVNLEVILRAASERTASEHQKANDRHRVIIWRISQMERVLRALTEKPEETLHGLDCL